MAMVLVRCKHCIEIIMVVNNDTPIDVTDKELEMNIYGPICNQRYYKLMMIRSIKLLKWRWFQRVIKRQDTPGHKNY